MNHDYHQKLQSKFPGKQLVKVISTQRDCPLSLKERWVYSTLYWCYKCKPVSKARLSKRTGVDRTRTLPRILTRLSNLRLVEKEGKKFKSVEPPADLMPWFAKHIVGYGANERLVPSYNWAVYIRSRDIIDNLVACADSLGHHSAAKLAKRFGVCAKTITAARRRLKKTTQYSPLEAIAEVKAVVVENPSMPPITPQTVVQAVPPVALAGYEQPLAPPSLKARHVAADHARFHSLEPGPTKELERLCELLKGLSSKEIGQIVSVLVRKYGKGEGLEDALWMLIQQRGNDYVFGTTYEKVMKDIGGGISTKADDEDDDDLSIFGDEEAEFATAG